MTTITRHPAPPPEAASTGISTALPPELWPAEARTTALRRRTRPTSSPPPAPGRASTAGPGTQPVRPVRDPFATLRRLLTRSGTAARAKPD